MHGWELRRSRLEAGLTLAQVARAAGTAAPNISAYEQGTKRPRQLTLDRLQAAIAAGGHSVVHQRSLLTAAAAAAQIRRGLGRGWPTADLLRLVREMVTTAGAVVRPLDRALFFAEPSTTGDQRWDAMLAAAVEHTFLTWGEPAPAWTAGHALPTFWFVGSTPGLHAFAFAHAPMSMQVRGIMVDPADLVAV
jgi:transcriptional regulator with XRE-family HTH domain